MVAGAALVTADKLLEGWYDLEGVFGNKYRWIGEHAAVRLLSVRPGPQRLRIRGHASEGHAVELSVSANGQKVGEWKLDRSGLFVVEADLPEAHEYRIEIKPARRGVCLQTTAFLQSTSA